MTIFRRKRTVDLLAIILKQWRNFGQRPKLDDSIIAKFSMNCQLRERPHGACQIPHKTVFVTFYDHISLQKTKLCS